ncbi:MAG: glutamate--tRNA ligase, partial [Anaerolineae bacterium]|nr:glutamate--tRNA ligase [Anaerolineae bacterium]
TALTGLPDFGAGSVEEALRALPDELGLKKRQLFGLVRAAVTGQRVTPPLFETVAVIGAQKSLARLQAAQDMLDQAVVEG